MKSLIDENTLTKLRDGSHKAYQDIYLTYKESIEAFLCRLLGSADEVEELTQSIFVNIWEKRAAIDPRKNIKAYLFSVAKNSALNYFKHKGVHSRFVKNEMYGDKLDFNTDESMIAHETQLLIELTVSRMPQVRREIFKMSRYEGLNNDEIAKKLNISTATVYSHISNAMRDLREVLAMFVILMTL